MGLIKKRRKSLAILLSVAIGSGFGGAYISQSLQKTATVEHPTIDSELIEEIRNFEHTIYKEDIERKIEKLYPEYVVNPNTISLGMLGKIITSLESEYDPEVHKQAQEDNLCIVLEYLNDPVGDQEQFIIGLGNGFLIADDLVLTAYHLFSTANNNYLSDLFLGKDLTVVPNDNIPRKTSIVAISPRYDLAILKLDKPVENVIPYPVRELEESNQTFSCPHYLINNESDSLLDLAEHQKNNIELNKISKKEGIQLIELETPYGAFQSSAFTIPQILANPAVIPGTSGSAVLNEEGYIIGVVSNSPGENLTGIPDKVYKLLEEIKDIGLIYYDPEEL